MRVAVTGDGALRATLTAPSGAQAGGPDNDIYGAEVIETGLYQPTETESPMAEPWAGAIRAFVVASPC